MKGPLFFSVSKSRSQIFMHISRYLGSLKVYHSLPLLLLLEVTFNVRRFKKT